MKSLNYLEIRVNELHEKLWNKSEEHSKVARFGYVYGLTLIAVVSLVAKGLTHLLLRVEIAIVKEALELATDSDEHVYSFNEE